MRYLKPFENNKKSLMDASFPKKINENKQHPMMDLVKNYDKEVKETNIKYRDKFINIISLVLKNVGIDTVNNMFEEGYMESTEIEYRNGTFKEFDGYDSIIYWEEESEVSVYIHDVSISTLSEIVTQFLGCNELMILFNEKYMRKINESSEFTSKFRTHGYMITPENEEKIRRMFNDTLNILYKNPKVMDMIEEKLRDKEITVAEGDYFDYFNKGENEWWEISSTYMNNYIEETEEYYSSPETQSLETLNIAVLCDIYDEVMRNANLDMNKIMKRINGIEI